MKQRMMMMAGRRPLSKTLRVCALLCDTRAAYPLDECIDGCPAVAAAKRVAPMIASKKVCLVFGRQQNIADLAKDC
jgi:hypothetical protein